MEKYNPTFIKGTLIAATEPGVDLGVALEKRAVEESGRIQIGPIQYFSVDYGQKDPVLYVRSKDAFYRLFAPNKGYKEVFKTFNKKVTITAKILNVWAIHPGCSLIDLAKHGNALQLDEIAEHGQFIMEQLRRNEDPNLLRSELLKRSLPEFLNRYTKNEASVRKGAKLHESNKLLLEEMKRVEEDTVNFMSRNWEVVKGFATGLPAKVLQRLQAAASSPNTAEDREREERIVEACDLITETPKYIGFSTMRDYQLDGLKWLIDKYMRGLRGMILADEMVSRDFSFC